jgi:hypothetical protein
MMMKRTFRFARTGPDFLGDELTEALKSDAWFEFNPLFIRVYNKLRERKATGGGQEMLRLRMYEKLQGLVKRGIVEKNGKSYRGNAPALAALAEQVAAQQCQRLLDLMKKPKSHANGELETARKFS